VPITLKRVTQIDDPRYVKALSHPLRVRILALLQERTASPRELAEWLGASLGTVAYHVRTLHEVGLIELGDTTQVHGAIAHHYRAVERPSVSEADWAAAGPVVKQAAVGAALQTIDEYARASAAAGGFDRTEAQLSRTSLRLDAKGWQQAAKASDKLVADLRRIEEAAAKRLAKDPEAGSDAALAILLFEAVRLSGQDGNGPPPPERKRARRGKRATRN
jgi:DNA-binding transcriptional ArsR family regulator